MNLSKGKFTKINYRLAIALVAIFAFSSLEFANNTNAQNDQFLRKSDMKDTRTQAPTPTKNVKELTIHGDTRQDSYYWLNDRENNDVISYLEAENEFSEQFMNLAKDLQDTIYEEIIARIDPQNESVPYLKNGYYYITRYEEGKEYPIYSRKKGSLEAEEEIMLDVNQMAEGHDYYQVGGLSVSPDNKWLAYGVDTVSRRIYTIHFKNLETGETIEEQIPNTTGSSTWAADSKTLFYSVKDETLRPYQIYKYKRGNVGSSTLVYEEKDPTFLTYVYKTRTDKYIIIGSYATVSNEYRILPSDQPDGKFEVFQERERGLEYSISHARDKWLVVTNKDAVNFKVMTAEEGKTGMEDWKEFIPHNDQVLVESLTPFENFLVIDQRKEGMSQIEIRSWDGKTSYDFPTTEDVYLVNSGRNPEYYTDSLRVSYQSMVTPPSVYDMNMKTRVRVLKKQMNVPTYQPANYETERIWVTARDGAEIPVSLVYHKDYQDMGEAPLLLYGYGSYGNSIDPYFSFSRISLLDRGFAFAIAHVRGGQEMGRAWYDDGKLLNKKNTFNDFIDVGKYLVQFGYAHPQKLCAMGGSAGGLLMGAVVNMEPSLWRAVIAAVPFVDVITTMLDETIPLTTGEYDEWGNPNDKKYYDYIKSYSPYDNVKRQDYPAMLVTTGLHDSQVQYWEPAKWVAKLREYKTDSRPLLLVTNMETGHSGASGRYKRHKETAMEYAFLCKMVNISK